MRKYGRLKNANITAIFYIEKAFYCFLKKNIYKESSGFVKTCDEYVRKRPWPDGLQNHTLTKGVQSGQGQAQ